MTRFIPAVQKTLKRIDRSLSGPLVIFSEQFLYGHREILCSYAGLDSQAMIKGSMEHGWSYDAGRGIPKFTGNRYLYLSWSKERLERSKNRDANAYSVGAPFIYAYQSIQNLLNSTEIRKKSPKREVLFFPTHGNEYHQQNVESQIQLFSEVYKPQESAVCLYWAEYINPDIYQQYKLAGFEIVCAGFSGQMENTGLGYSARQLAGSPVGGRPTFLLNTIAFLSSYPKVVLGGIGSICFYASFLKCEIEFLHKYIDTEFLDMDSKTKSKYSENYHEMTFRNYVSNYIDQDFKEIDFNSKQFQELANLELGVSSMLNPKELRDFLSPHVILEAHPQSLNVYQEKLKNFINLQASIN